MAEHNLPFAIADYFNTLIPIMFPNNKIAAEFACATTKTAALVIHVLTPAANESVVSALLEQPFTILESSRNNPSLPPVSLVKLPTHTAISSLPVAVSPQSFDILEHSLSCPSLPPPNSPTYTLKTASNTVYLVLKCTDSQTK